MATIHAHPTLLQNSWSLRKLQQETGLKLVCRPHKPDPNRNRLHTTGQRSGAPEPGPGGNAA